MTDERTGRREYLRGTVHSYNMSSAFGFIEPDEPQGQKKLLLVHGKSLRHPGQIVEPGQRVLFTTRQIATGMLAVDVHPEEVEDESIQGTEELVDGLVQSYNSNRGFGFIVFPDKREAFFHISYVVDSVDTIRAGLPITCSLVPSARGLQAQNVRRRSGLVLKDSSGIDLLPQAMIARDSRSYEEAATLYERGLLESPSVQLVLSYAAMEKNRGRKANARRIYEAGIRLYPEVAKLREDAGVLAASQQDYQSAIKLLEEALAICRNTDQGGEKGVLLGLARTHYQIGNSSSLRECIRNYTSAQALFGRGSTRLPEADLLRLNLARTRTQHHRGKLTVDFLERSGFHIVKAIPQDRTTEGADLIIELNAPELQESYGISRYLMVRCVFKSDVGVSDLADIDSNISTWSKRGLADDQLGLLIVASLPPELQRLLSQRIEDRRRMSPAIVPIQQTDIETEADPMVVLRTSLDRWLYRRDLFAVNSPVDGRRFFGRDKPLAELRDSIAASVPAGVFGLRKVGKTSLLKETQRRSAELGDIVVYLDLSRVPSDISDCRWIYWKLASDLRDQVNGIPLQDFKWRLGGEFEDFLDVAPTFPVATAFDSDLTRLLQAIRKSLVTPRPKVVLLLDEIERLLPNRLGKAGFAGFFEFFSYLRGVAQENNEFVFTVTGANAAISEAAQFDGRDNPVFNYFKEVYLQLLEFSECATMLRELGRGMGIRFDEHAIEAIYEASGGHPFFTRQFCSFVAQQYPERPLTVRRTMLPRLIDRYLEVRSDDFQEIAERLSRDFPGELEICIKLAQAGGKVDRVVTDEIVRAGSAVRHLTGYQILQIDHSSASIKIKMFAQWLQRRYGKHD